MSTFEQYDRIKAENPDSLLLFKMGDFYEAFHDDAEVIAKKLGLTITTRSRKSENPIPMSGFPYHQLEAYLGKLVKEGFRVAICEQVPDPRNPPKGLVKREIVSTVPERRTG